MLVLYVAKEKAYAGKSEEARGGDREKPKNSFVSAVQGIHSDS
jgi:hypothetical protein